MEEAAAAVAAAAEAALEAAATAAAALEAQECSRHEENDIQTTSRADAVPTARESLKGTDERKEAEQDDNGAGKSVAGQGTTSKRQRQRLGECEVCCANPARYRCPACGVTSCSVGCVTAHKAKTECTGMAPRTRYAAHVAELPPNVLWNDYCLLEDAARFVGAAQRGPPGSELGHQAHHGHKRRRPVKAPLARAAEQQGIALDVLPVGMERHEKNTSSLTRSRQICWRIDWVFRLPGIAYTTESALGSTPVATLLDAYLLQTPDNALQRHRVPEYWKRRAETVVLLQDLRRPANDQRYVKIDPELPLNKALRGARIIEYPTLYIVLPEELEHYPLADALAPPPPPSPDSVAAAERHQRHPKTAKRDRQGSATGSTVEGVGAATEETDETGEAKRQVEPTTRAASLPGPRAGGPPPPPPGGNGD